MRVVAIDYGRKKMGIAISDPNKVIATPFKVIQANKDNISTIKKILDLLKPYEKEIETILIGLPVLLSGNESEMTKEVKSFVEEFKKHTSFNVLTYDERLTSHAADTSLKEVGYKRKKRDKISDAIAASIFLQDYLDSIKK